MATTRRKILASLAIASALTIGVSCSTSDDMDKDSPDQIENTVPGGGMTPSSITTMPSDVTTIAP